MLSYDDTKWQSWLVRQHVPCSTSAQPAWPSSSCAWSSWGWCSSSSCASCHHHVTSAPGAASTPSGCCSHSACVHLPAAFPRRSASAGLAGYLSKTRVKSLQIIKLTNRNAGLLWISLSAFTCAEVRMWKVCRWLTIANRYEYSPSLSCIFAFTFSIVSLASTWSKTGQSLCRKSRTQIAMNRKSTFSVCSVLVTLWNSNQIYFRSVLRLSSLQTQAARTYSHPPPPPQDFTATIDRTNCFSDRKIIDRVLRHHQGKP